MGLKVSSSMNKALDTLRSFADDQLKTLDSINTLNLTVEQATELTDNFTTTLHDGTERGVSLGDLEAVGNFERDVRSGVKVITHERGIPFLSDNAEVDSFKLSVRFPEIAGHGLSVTNAVYRPGKEDEDNNTYEAVTRSWTSSEDDKAIDEHLLGLAAKLKGAKAKK